MNDASAINSSMTGSCNHSAAAISSNCHILQLNSLRYVSCLNLWPFNFLHKPGSNILINKFIFFHGSDPEKEKRKRMNGSFFHIDH